MWTEEREKSIREKLRVTCGWCLKWGHDEDSPDDPCRCTSTDSPFGGCVRGEFDDPCEWWDYSDAYEDMILEAATKDLPDALEEILRLREGIRLRDYHAISLQSGRKVCIYCDAQ